MHKIPYRLVNGIILIPASANGQEGCFAFDTGAMQTAVNKAYFPEIQGARIDIAKFSEGVTESTADKGILNSLCFSTISLSDLPVLIMDLMYVENVLKTIMPELKLLGTLGIDVIGNHTVMLDYCAPEVILDPEQEFETQTVIPMDFEKLPVIKVEVSGKVHDFVLDTGANTCLLGQSFLDDAALTPIPETPKVVNIPAVCVNGNTYTNIVAAVSDISPIQKRVPVDGVIGYQILSGQRSILDFKNRRLVFEVQ